MRVALNKENVKIIGRTANVGDNLLLAQTGSGIEFEYRGTGFDLAFIAGTVADTKNNEENYARIAVYVDGVRRNDVQLKNRRTVLRILRSPGDPALVENADLGVRRDPAGDMSVDAGRGVRRDPYLSQWCKDDGTHIIRVIKLSEVAMSLAMIEPFEIAEGESVCPTPALSHRIEFIGDSITCGYGVDDEDPLHLFKTATEDMTRAYAFKTAAALNADYSCFASSGYGIISGWTDDISVCHDDQLIPSYYESLGLSYDSIEGSLPTTDIKWDFARFVPEAIVINLGTNDDSYCTDDESRQMKFAGLYADFLKRVRELNPGAYIFCVLGVMGDRLYPFVSRAVEMYRDKSGDEKIMALHLPEQDAAVGYVCDYHPLESAHHKAAQVMAEAISKQLNW